MFSLFAAPVLACCCSGLPNAEMRPVSLSGVEKFTNPMTLLKCRLIHQCLSECWHSKRFVCVHIYSDEDKHQWFWLKETLTVILNMHLPAVIVVNNGINAIRSVSIWDFMIQQRDRRGMNSQQETSCQLFSAHGCCAFKICSSNNWDKQV